MGFSLTPQEVFELSITQPDELSSLFADITTPGLVSVRGEMGFLRKEINIKQADLKRRIPRFNSELKLFRELFANNAILLGLLPRFTTPDEALVPMQELDVGEPEGSQAADILEFVTFADPTGLLLGLVFRPIAGALNGRAHKAEFERRVARFKEILPNLRRATQTLERREPELESNLSKMINIVLKAINPNYQSTVKADPKTKRTPGEQALFIQKQLIASNARFLDQISQYTGIRLQGGEPPSDIDLSEVLPDLGPTPDDWRVVREAWEKIDSATGILKFKNLLDRFAHK